eukprot:9490620-Pyramimonas_sp.AAC.1
MAAATGAPQRHGAPPTGPAPNAGKGRGASTRAAVTPPLGGKGRQHPTATPAAAQRPVEASPTSAGGGDEGSSRRRGSGMWSWLAGRRRDPPPRRSTEDAGGPDAGEEEVRGWFSFGGVKFGVSWLGGWITDLPPTEIQWSDLMWGGGGL